MAANTYEAAARTVKALDLERVLIDAGATAALVELLGRDAREIAEREVHKRRQALKPPHQRRPFTDDDRGSTACWAVVVELMRRHESAADTATGQPVRSGA